MKKTPRIQPTRQEIRDIRKIQRLRDKLRHEESAACRALVEKYVPCKPGDIIEGGSRHVEQGRVSTRECHIFEDGSYQFRVSYYPRRGKRFLKHTRSFNDLGKIKVITPATPSK